MRILTALVLCFAIATSALANPSVSQVWKVEPPGEGSAETYVYTAPGGSFISNSPNSLWIVYGINAPQPDGTCTFDSCGIGVTVDGKDHRAQSWVGFEFSDGSVVRVDHPEFDFVVSDAARANWPLMHSLISKLKQNNSVTVFYADGASQHFSLAGSSEAIERGAAIQALQ